MIAANVPVSGNKKGSCENLPFSLWFDGAATIFGAL